MSFDVVIPARYASTRLPGKPLLELNGKPMVLHVIDRAKESQAARIIVATDDARIRQAVKENDTYSDIDICMTSPDHESGTDRIAEVVDTLQITADRVIVNVQGDEPLIPARLIDEVAKKLMADSDAVMSTAAHAIDNKEEINNPNVVKVVFDRHGKALYFSRSLIPFARDSRVGQVWRHIGIYAYRAEFLANYSALPVSELEQNESLEQLRVMENGDSIVVQTVDYDVGMGIDTPADAAAVQALLADQ